MRTTIRATLILILLIVCKITLSQIVISGKIVDKKSLEPLPYVNMGVEGASIGTITDPDGVFNLKIQDQYRNSNIIVSSVGYENQKISISKFAGNKNVLVELTPIDFHIDEVKVVDKSLFPYKIIRTATEKIQDNYLSKAFNYELYYCNELSENGNLKQKREAIVKLYDSNGYKRSNAYSAFTQRNYKFVKSKRNFDVFSINDGLTNLDELLEFDIVRNSGNILDKNHLTDFDIVIEQEVLINSDSVWILNYKCKKTNLVNTYDFYCTKYEGKITIRKKDFVVLRNEVFASSSKLSELGRNYFIGSNDQNFATNINYSFSVEYKKDDNKFVLSSIQLSQEMDLKSSENIIDKLNIKSSVGVKKVVSQNPEKITKREYFEGLAFDAVFWQNYK